MKVKKILFPTDFSERSEQALKFANLFLDKYQSQIDLIHVVPLSMYLHDSIDKLGLPLDMDSDLYPKILEHAKEKLEELASTYIKSKHLGELTVLVDRKPSSAISDFANKNGFDLLLMSAKGAHETTFFKGSITEKVMRKSEIPVLTVNDNLSEKGFERILAPLDFSDHSFSAIPLAFELAYQFDASLEFIYVNELYIADDYGFAGPVAGGSNEVSSQLFQDRLEEYFLNHKDRGLSIQQVDNEYNYRIIKNEGASSISMPVRLKVIRGISASREISEYAHDNADLLLLSTHGRSGLSRYLMGSVAGQVVQNTDISTLTVRPDNFKLD